MTFSEYQKRAITTATVTADHEVSIYYHVLGLVSEAGEVADKIKKVVRNQKGDFSQLDKNDFKKELGDVLWYLSMLSTIFEFDLTDVAQTNLDKLADRQKRGVISSTGDVR